jgi:hypothetical protein
MSILWSQTSDLIHIVFPDHNPATVHLLQQEPQTVRWQRDGQKDVSIQFPCEVFDSRENRKGRQYEWIAKKREEEYWGTRDIVSNVPIGIDWEHFMDEDEEDELYKKFYIPDEIMSGRDTHDKDEMSELLASLSQAGDNQDQP